MLRIANLTRNVTNEVLTDICECFGEPQKIEFVNYPGTQKFKGVAYVTYASNEEARQALACLAPGKVFPGDEPPPVKASRSPSVVKEEKKGEESESSQERKESRKGREEKKAREEPE